MSGRLPACLLFATCLFAAAPKTVATATGDNRDVALTVTLYIDPAGVKNLVGNDLDGHYVVADVKMEPKDGKEATIDRGDFLLRTDSDGDKAEPSAPSQIAGRGAIVVHQSEQERRGLSPGMGGNVRLVPTGVTVQSGEGEREGPLEGTLKEKALPEKKTSQPVSGLLYFLMEKQKMKDLELTYGSGQNRITLRFK
jgi:hypothetical protein